MKSMLLLSLLVLAAMPAWPAGTHDATNHAAHRVLFDPKATYLTLTTDPAMIEAGQPVRLELRLTDAHGATMTKFETVHEKKVHLIMVREDLDVFAHLHPELHGDGLFGITVEFPVPGTYFLHADFTPEEGQASTARAELRVEGQPPTAPALEPHVPGRVQTSELLADISLLEASDAYQVGFSLMGLDETPITDLEPYLGAMGHLVVLSADGQNYVHAHPLASSQTAEVAFEVHFPGPGIYKGWGEFQRGGAVMTVPFVTRIGAQ